jgi:hypothetical protein
VDSSLVDGTDYKVRVADASDATIYDESDAFTIEGKSITVTEPTAGAIWAKGNSASITWTSTGAISYMKIDLYKGTTLKQTIVTSTIDDGSYTWSNVASTLEDGTDYKIRVTDTGDSTMYDESDAFTIEDRSITVTAPTSSTVWAKDESATITWTSKGTITNVKIQLYKGTTFQKTIILSTPDNGSYTWPTVDTSLVDDKDYKVRILDANDTSLYGESESFQIGEPGITVTAPTSSTVWYRGDSADITWTSKGTTNYVKIELYKEDILVKTITQSTSNDGAYYWYSVDTTLAAGTDYKVKITSTTDSSLYGESPNFEISPGLITVTSPTSSTEWFKGKSGQTNWTSKGELGSVQIDLYKGTTKVDDIHPSTSDDGSHAWPTVNTSLADGTDYKVRITSTTDSNIYGESAQFKISTPSITVTAPASSTVWGRGQSVAINWTSKGASSYVIIELYKGTTLEKTIDSWEYNDGSYTWSNVDPNLADGTDYKVRITDDDDSTLYGESAQFEIGPAITVTAPTTGTQWTKGQSATINWTNKGSISQVRIELHKGTSGSVWLIPGTGYVSNTGSYSVSSVNEGLADGTDYKVKISNSYDSNEYGYSDEFEIKSGSIISKKKAP